MAKTFEDLLDDLRDKHDIPDSIITELEEAAADASPLRKQVKQLTAKAAKADEYEKKLAKYEKAPKVREAFEKLGVVFEELRPAELRAIESFDYEGDEIDGEAVAKFIKEYDLPVDAEAQLANEDVPPAERIADTAMRHRTGSSPTRVTAEDTEGWSTEDLLRFKEKHPEEYEQLKRGETVAVAFSPKG